MIAPNPTCNRQITSAQIFVIVRYSCDNSCLQSTALTYLTVHKQMKSNILFNLMLEYIKTFPSVAPPYQYDSEKGMYINPDYNEKYINPAYCDIDHCLPLCLHEKRIWVLRTDLTLATGIKNANLDEGNTNIFSKIDETMHELIDPDDRYGHPSLAHPANGYDGSVYYTGWLHQHGNHLEVFVGSGRYHNKQLRPQQQKFLEFYIYLKLLEVYGEQKIIFTDYFVKEELEGFLKGDSYQDRNKPTRFYTPIPTKLTCMLILLFTSSLNGHQDKKLEALSAVVVESIGYIFNLALRGISDYFLPNSGRTHRTSITSVSIFKTAESEAETVDTKRECDITKKYA